MHIEKRTVSVGILILFNVSIMASLRNLPLVAEFGMSLIFFFLVTALAFLIPCALVSAELATGWPKDGGIYVWVREALGDTWGFFAIWMQWAHNLTWYPAILSFVATTLAFAIDQTLATNKLYILLLVLVLFWGMTFINYFGVRTSATISSIGVVLGTILPGIVIIALGSIWYAAGNARHITLGWAEIIPSADVWDNLTFIAGLFLAFAGLEVSAGYASSVKSPRKNYPRAIIAAALITFFLFMLGSLSIAMVIPKSQISLVTGVIETLKIILSRYHVEWALPVMAILLSIGAVAETNSWLMGPIKALYSTAQHGNLPPIFQKLNAYGMPTNMLLFQAIIVSFASVVIILLPDLSAAYWILSALSAQMYLIMYLLMFIAAIVLRYKKPHVPRSYEIPHKHKGIWTVCLIGSAATIFGFVIAFIPPSAFNVGSLLFYELFMILSLLVMSAIPLLIHQFRSPDWFILNDKKKTVVDNTKE